MRCQRTDLHIEEGNRIDSLEIGWHMAGEVILSKGHNEISTIRGNSFQQMEMEQPGICNIVI